MNHKIALLLFLYCSPIFFASHSAGREFIIQDTVPVMEATCIVTDFYKVYTASFLSNLSSSESLDMEKYLTKRLIEKINRVRSAVGADPVIRAQDFNETAFETLNVKPLGNNWYMVNYRWNMNDEGSSTSIPLKVSLVDGRYLIDYITPEWNGSLYGDTLLCEDTPQCAVDNSTPQSMMESFYTAYTTLYGNMPEGLGVQLKTLRDVHLTPNALNQFEEAANEYKLDGLPDCDLLIDNFDFDCLWLSSIVYTPLTENSFRISSKQGELATVLVITLIAYDGEYKIDNIQREKQI